MDENNKKGHQYWKGKHLSEEHKQKISKNSKRVKYWLGKHHSEESKQKMSNSRKGKKHTKKSKEKMSLAKKGKPRYDLKGKSLSQETKRKISEANRGKNHYKWRSGISSLYEKIRKNFQYRQWRSDVFTRDEFTCQKCGIKSGYGKAIYLEVHHIKPMSKILEENNIKTIENAINCQELWNINNGITLCKECHNKTKFGRKK